MGFPEASAGKESTCNAGDMGDAGSVPGSGRSPGEGNGDHSIPGSGRSPGEGNGDHSSILAWRISWTEEPGGLQSMGSHRTEHD